MHPKNKAPKREVEKFRDHARAVVEHYFGGAPKRLTFLDSGLSNFVFSARHASGNFIIRLSPNPGRLDTFIKEHWAQAEAAKHGVPTSRILETGAGIVPFPYMIIEHTDGIEATEHTDRLRIVRELGRHAAVINSIKTEGYGETFNWSGNELSKRKSFAEFLDDEFCADERLEILVRNRIIDEKADKVLRRVLREMRAIKSKPRLNHSDLRLKNVFVDEAGGIKAILDWEKAISNITPQWELSIALHDLNIDEKQAFLDGYGMTPRRLKDISPPIKVFNMLNYTQAVQAALETKDRGALANIRQRFSTDLELYSL